MSATTKKISCSTCKERSSCFNVLKEPDYLMLDANRVELKFKKGEVICKQGAFANSIMYIYSGMAKAYLESDNGKYAILNIFPSGKMIGLTTLFCDNVFPYSASAVEDCVICSIDINIFEEYTKKSSVFASEVIKTLNNCTHQIYDRYLSVTQKHMNGRLADALIYLANNIYQSHSFKMSLSRQDLAEMTQMSAESITRIISQFKTEKLIKISGKHYEIIDYDELINISQSE